MRLKQIRIRNFRAHKDTQIPLTQIGCLIGENNAGKSSVLQAIQYVLEDKKVTTDDFRDPNLPVSVELTIEGIDEEDLLRVSESHRDRVSEMIDNGTITIIKQQVLGDKPENKYLKLVPRDPSWKIETLEEKIKDKKGVELRAAAVSLLPELDSKLTPKPSQKAIKEAYESLLKDIPREELEPSPAPYPSGITNSVKPLLPSVIYIESVKDASIEAKATGTSAFSKILTLLFEEVGDQFDDIEHQFQSVFEKFNRYLAEDGTEIDNRLDAVKRIESMIESFVRSSFAGVSLRMHVPAPTLPKLLSDAELQVDDGHVGSISSKGDGLKRTVLFALLRAYASMRNTGLNEKARSKSPRPSYILLFEEPELYLHPQAQRQLMEALVSFSQEHQVLVTTHSPGFFRPGTKGFARLQKTTDGVSAHPVSLTLSHRDAYQIVKHENNEAAFFARRVVLVEGDSDTFVYPHLARLIDHNWDDIDKNIMFVKIDGKGNIRRYREFFSSFNIPIHVITDLDSLVRGFEQLTENPNTKSLHKALMEEVDKNIPKENTPNSSKVKKICDRRTPAELWSKAQSHLGDWLLYHKEEDARLIQENLNLLFASGNNNAQLKELAEPSTPEVNTARKKLLQSLAKEKVYVLSRGDLETYCGTNSGKDKVAGSIDFCQRVTNLESFRQLHERNADDIIAEMQRIFSNIYE